MGCIQDFFGLIHGENWCFKGSLGNQRIRVIWKPLDGFKGQVRGYQKAVNNTCDAMTLEFGSGEN